MAADIGTITTTDGRTAKVDADVADEYRGRQFCMEKGQARDIKTDITLAKLIMGLPKGLDNHIKFTNGDMLDCRRENMTVIRRGGTSAFDDLFE
jgi:hypothetical protein